MLPNSETNLHTRYLRTRPLIPLVMSTVGVELAIYGILKVEIYGSTSNACTFRLFAGLAVIPLMSLSMFANLLAFFTQTSLHFMLGRMDFENLDLTTRSWCFGGSQGHEGGVAKIPRRTSKLNAHHLSSSGKLAIVLVLFIL